MLRNFSLQLWPQPLFKTTRKYLQKFANWREMLKLRGRVRHDGIYRCKMKYIKQGLSYHSEYHPIYEVTTYKYVRFLRNGQSLSIFTTKAPKRIFPKIKQNMLRTQLGLQRTAEADSYVAYSDELQIQGGRYQVYNDMVSVSEMINATEYRFDFKCFRQMGFPSYLQEEERDHLKLEW